MTSVCGKGMGQPDKNHVNHSRKIGIPVSKNYNTGYDDRDLYVGKLKKQLPKAALPLVGCMNCPMKKVKLCPFELKKAQSHTNGICLERLHQVISLIPYPDNRHIISMGDFIHLYYSGMSFVQVEDCRIKMMLAEQKHQEDKDNEILYERYTRAHGRFHEALKQANISSHGDKNRISREKQTEQITDAVSLGSIHKIMCGESAETIDADFTEDNGEDTD